MKGIEKEHLRPLHWSRCRAARVRGALFLRFAVPRCWRSNSATLPKHLTRPFPYLKTALSLLTVFRHSVSLARL